METPETIRCPICERDLSVNEFGICRQRKSGHNLYCKPCVRSKTNDQRKALREYKQIRKRYQVQGIEYHDETFEPKLDDISKLSPVERVREAIRNGCRTQKEIHKETKLGLDEIGDAIANLLLWTREIRTVVVDDVRMYFVREESELERKPNVVSPSLWTVANQVGPVVKGERRARAVA